MAVFNRILNILVMLMAIAAAVFSWKLYERRKEMRERGDMLAQKINAAAVAIDELTPENDRVAAIVGVQGIDQGKSPLGWMNYHVESKRTDYVGNLDKFITAATKVRQQRDDNSTSLNAVDKLFKEHNEDMVAKYNDPTQSEQLYNDLEVVLKSFYKRDNELADFMLANVQLFDPGYQINRAQMREDYAKAQDKLDLAIKHEQTQNRRKTSTLESMASILTSEYFGALSENMKELSIEDQKVINEKVTKIKSDLDRIVILEQTIKDREDTIKDKEAIIADKETIIQRKTAQVNTLLEKEKNYKLKIDMLVATIERMTDPDKIGADRNVKYDGNILKVNYDYNYVVISYSEKDDKLPISATLTVARDREYIAKVQVTKLFKNYAVADILPNEREGEIIEGDRVLKISF